MTWKPEDMILPAEKSTLKIEPMKLIVGKGHFASRIIDLLRLKDRCVLLCCDHHLHHDHLHAL